MFELGRHRHHFKGSFFSYEAIEDDQQSCTRWLTKVKYSPRNEELAPLGFTSDLWDLPRIYGMKLTILTMPMKNGGWNLGWSLFRGELLNFRGVRPCRNPLICPLEASFQVGPGFA